jgi:predicted phage-related endonuclease
MVALAPLILTLTNSIGTKGARMSVQIEKGIIDFDTDTNAWLEQYKTALIKIKEWQEVAEISRAHIESALGESELGMFANRPVVRWSFVESKRFDTKRAREILPVQVIEALEIVSKSRRFTIVNDDE